MAVTTQDIINRAQRRLGILGATETPDPTASAQALEILKSIYQRFIIEGVTGALRDVVVEDMATYTAGENERILLDSAVTSTVNLPETVSNYINYAVIEDFGDGHVTVPGVHGAKRLPRDLAVVSVNDKAQLITEDHIYDGSRKQWFSITTLELTDEAPLSHRDATGLACTLATELASEYGMPFDEITARAATRYQNALVTNYSQGGEAVSPPSFI